MRGLFVAALLVLTQWPSTASAFTRSCNVPYIRTLKNQTVPGHMYVKSGKRCSVVLARAEGPILTAHLVVKAKFGTVSLAGHRVTYISKPKFLGEDRFTYAREGFDARNNPVRLTVEMTVHVEPK